MFGVISSYGELTCLWQVKLTDITLIPIKDSAQYWYCPLTPKAFIERDNSQ